MRIQNSTSWPVYFLRRMTSWCAKELEMTGKQCALAVFRNSKATWGGAARGWRKQITVCITKQESDFPAHTRNHWGQLQEIIADRIEALVKVTAHELTHLRNWNSSTRQSGNPGGSEAVTDTNAFRVLQAFRLKREALLVEWNQEPVMALRGPQLTVIEKRAQKAQKDLERWQRKLKLAQTKVRKLKARVQYYTK